MNKALDNFGTFVAQRAPKLTRVTVQRGKTVIPSASKDLENYGLRADYDNIYTAPDGTKYHKLQIQPNAGKIPSSIKQWRDSQPTGTHSVMGVMYVKVDGTTDDVKDAYAQFRKAFKANTTTPPPGSRAGTPTPGPSTPQRSREGTPVRGREGTAERSREGTPDRGREGTPHRGREGTPSRGGEGTPDRTKSGTPSKSRGSTPVRK